MPHGWTPIEELPPAWAALTDGELGPLLQLWGDLREELEQDKAIEEFSGRLAREWAIETGQIEGVYDLDRGITQTLIERGINADLIPRTAGQRPPEAVAAIIRDHADVLEGLFQFVRGDRGLSKSYIHELHTALLRHQETTAATDQFGRVFETELIRGRYKIRPNNPTRPDGALHEYCPPEHVEAEMDRLIAIHADHEATRVPVEISSAWLHHRFSQIHPYQDGNGRVARCLATLAFLRSGWFPVVVTRDDRARYIDALEVGDKGDLRAFITYLVDVQKRALFQATRAAADVQPAETVSDAIKSAKRVLTGAAQRLDPAVWLRAKETADHLMGLASSRLEEVAGLLSVEIGANRPEFMFAASPAGHLRAGIGDQELGYAVNTLDYGEVRTLEVNETPLRRQWIIYVQAHAIGSRFRGLIGVIVVLGFEAQRRIASAGPFQVNYAESRQDAERRFRPWLERSLTQALTLWRQTL